MKTNYYAVIDNNNGNQPYVYHTTTSLNKAKKINSKMGTNGVLKITEDEYRFINNVLTGDVLYLGEVKERFKETK